MANINFTLMRIAPQQYYMHFVIQSKQSKFTKCDFIILQNVIKSLHFYTSLLRLNTMHIYRVFQPCSQILAELHEN